MVIPIFGERGGKGRKGRGVIFCTTDEGKED